MSYVSTSRGLGAPVSTSIESSIGTGLLSAAPFTGPAAPFLAAGGAVADLLASFGIGSGCGQTCVLSSQYADKAEGILKNNVGTYLGLPVPRSSIAQQAALSIFDTVWNDLSAQCSNPSLGDPGRRCISDRQRGGKFDWFGWYRDPIANDTNVVQDSTVDSAAAAVSNALGTSVSPWLLLAGAGLVGLVVLRA